MRPLLLIRVVFFGRLIPAAGPSSSPSGGAGEDGASRSVPLSIVLALPADGAPPLGPPPAAVPAPPEGWEVYYRRRWEESQEALAEAVARAERLQEIKEIHETALEGADSELLAARSEIDALQASRMSELVPLFALSWTATLL
jgi:hypothetical protein